MKNERASKSCRLEQKERKGTFIYIMVTYKTGYMPFIEHTYYVCNIHVLILKESCTHALYTHVLILKELK